MESPLNREETKEFMDLLNIHASFYGNVSVIRKAYIKAVKTLHPDKGGDEEKMKRLSVLYKKYCDGVVKNNAEGVAEDLDCSFDCTEVFKNVEYAIFSNVPKSTTMGQMYGDQVKEKICANWDLCSRFSRRQCGCVLCTLRGRHREKTKRFRHKKGPLYWLRCYCLKCFCEWFGFPMSFDAFTFWAAIIEDTPQYFIRVW